MRLGQVGIWWSGSWGSDAAETRDLGSEMEELGYSAIWMSGGFNPGLSDRFRRLLAATNSIPVASGIVSIWHTTPHHVAEGVAGLDRDFPGRFILGLGASHALAVDQAEPRYTRPFSRMVQFLDELDRVDPLVPVDRRVLAALGPKMLALAAARTAGAHPYFVPVEHTYRAREVLGAGPLRAPEQGVVLESDPDRAREVARSYPRCYFRLPNYTNNLRSLGFGDKDLAGAGSDRLVDAIVAL